MESHNWTKRELDQLEILHEIGFTLPEISQRLRIPEEVCYSKLKELGTSFKDDKQKVKSRPPTIYTNSRSPYGIADELHSIKRKIQ